MKNRDYIEGFIEGVSMCWNNGMKVCSEYTAIYIDTFFIDNDKNNDLNEIIKKKLLQYYESSSSEKQDDNIRKKLEKLNIVFKKNRKYEKLIKQNEIKTGYDRISEFIKLQTEFTVEEIIENLENKADKKEQYWNVRCFFNQITHWFGEPVNFYVAIKKYEAILSEFYAYNVFSAGIIRYKEYLLMIVYGSDE
ncbi:hypothetical protein [Leptotrichia sp. oral taxon 879]|uniref:hypothetical protein n=1 Tax=Leptotrichia sp. oral taxon 879 TaxID=1227267 RepID=UPI0003AE33CE|nr:hypothetical protein [Leptotrichia sp. oral taxon 879]ERK47882.1 hypothetical protein HMPREF1552_02234 [Leptotrichia sp. oral taxon 879 str. F0557]